MNCRSKIDRLRDTLLDQECGEDVDACLVYFAGLGHVKGVLRSIARGAKNWKGAIEAAAENGRLSIIEKLPWLEFENERQTFKSDVYASFLEKALKSGDWPTIQFLAKKSLNQSKSFVGGVFRQVIDSGNLELMKFALEEWKHINPGQDEIVVIHPNERDRQGKKTKYISAGPIKKAIEHAEAIQADDMLELLQAV